MTKEEFLSLDVDNVISYRFSRDKLYRIYDTDQMGTSYKGKIYRVLGAEEINTDAPHYVRIDQNNCDFWRIEGRMVEA